MPVGYATTLIMFGQGFFKWYCHLTYAFAKILKIGIKIYTIWEKIENPDSNRSHDITIDEVKSFPMFAQFSDAQASEVV